MKNKEKKTPKINKSEYILSSDAEAILYGLIMILLSVIGLLGNGVVGDALTYVFAYVFGVFYILVYVFVIFLGLYLIIKKQMYKIKIDVKVLGALLILFAFCISSSFNEQLEIGTFFSEFQNRVSESQEHIFLMKTEYAIFHNLGGGFIGFFLTGLLNTCLTPSGTSIVVIIILCVGLILLFKDIAIKLVKSLINLHKKRVEIRKTAKEEKENNEKGNVQKDENKNQVIEDVNVNNNAQNDDNKQKVVSNNDSFFFEDSINRQKPSDVINDLNEEDDNEEEINDNQDLDDEFDEKENLINSFDEEEQKKMFFNDNSPSEIIVNEDDNIYDEYNEDELYEDEYDDLNNDSLNEGNNEPVNLNNVVNQYNAINQYNEVIKNVNVEEQDDYVYPPLSLLKDRFNRDESERKNALAQEKMAKINECFSDLGIGANVISYTIGPSVTRFDVKCNTNVRTNVLSSIENDLAVRLGGNKTVRLETIVEGKNTSGIEVGNEICDMVSFKECMQALQANTDDKLLFPLGKNISGDIISGCLDEMPHLLVCGTTGSGKSVFIHNIIASLIMRNKPDELKLMLIDPKRIEFNRYNDLPHLLCPVITQTDRAKVALMRLVDEMEKRYDLFAEKGMGASNYKEYLETCEEMGYEKIPYIVMICDEFADFMSDGDKEVAKLIQRIAQKARACGIYMVIATQRPSVKVITGDIKANIPSRIALSVSSSLDSRIIIDEVGAENLLGKGDLLARIPHYKTLVRVQSAFIDSKELYAICEHIKSQAKFVCHKDFEDLTIKIQTPFSNTGDGDITQMRKDYHNDEIYEDVKRFVIKTGKCSTSKLINQFGIGYSKADGLLDTLEQDGIIRRDGSRRVLCDQYAHPNEEE